MKLRIIKRYARKHFDESGFEEIIVRGKGACEFLKIKNTKQLCRFLKHNKVIDIDKWLTSDSITINFSDNKWITLFGKEK